ncbi:hypothetical protein BDV34DRAFT_202195 [Aspergillus parasiticus]|uniref:Uncharacterized protein n=1 Tax=Aspergillus parasiticus TaxID=5067 RepID=A0A5N6DBT3_ASPPA|nr:hypothetical protein BDV34DRAFT_202195 [Aspergillus parasiticus]
MIPARGWWEAGAYLAELHLTLCLSLSLVSFSRRFHNSNHSFARSGLVLFIVFWSARAQYYCSSIIRSPSRSHTTLSPIHTETSRDVPKRPFQNPRSSSHSTTCPLTGSNRQSTETKDYDYNFSPHADPRQQKAKPVCKWNTDAKEPLTQIRLVAG